MDDCRNESQIVITNEKCGRQEGWTDQSRGLGHLGAMQRCEKGISPGDPGVKNLPANERTVVPSLAELGSQLCHG